ncbi:MAG TPA: alpha/beta fold hydrolase [Gemmatimonadaceae bacterium]|jgi:carboxylesterase
MRLNAFTFVAIASAVQALACDRSDATTSRAQKAHLHPAYSRAVAAIARRQAVDDSVAVPGARSILLTEGTKAPRVIVLLHGLTDSPRQFEALAYLLRADGNNVYVPRLPRHALRGGSVSALSGLTEMELRAAADSAVDEARGLGDSLVIVGLSMGATMGAWIAQERQVTRVVLIAPAIEPGVIPSLLDRPLVGLADHLPSITRPWPTDTTRPDREPGFNSRAAAAIFELGRFVLSEATSSAPRTRDIVVLVNASDRTVKESATEALAREWSKRGGRVSIFELPDSLRLQHNIFDPIRGRTGGGAVLALLRELAYGRPPTALVGRMTVSQARKRSVLLAVVSYVLNGRALAGGVNGRGGRRLFRER